MNKLLFLYIVCIIAIFWMGWRLLSRRHSLPCPSWLGWLVEMDNPFSTINRAATIIEHLDLKPGMCVLDVGCGPGRVSIPAAHKVGKQGNVVAMDIQEGMLHRCREKAQAENITNITFLQAGIGENKLESDTFDRVLLVTVLGEIPNQAAALDEIFKTLKPGGILSITEIIFDPHFQGQRKVRTLAHAAGFEESNLFGNRIAFTLNFTRPKK